MARTLSLRIVDETMTIPAVDAASLSRAVIERTTARLELPEDDRSRTDAFRLAGPALERWGFPHAPPAPRPVSICLSHDVIHLPGFGVILAQDGSVAQATAGVIVGHRRDLSILPGVTELDGDTRLAVPEAIETVDRAAVFQSWGGSFNYGHFLLDALPSLVALDEQGLLQRFVPIAPRLKPWQRRLLAMATDAPVRELKAPFVRLGSAVHATSMDHFLHGPGDLLARTRARLLAGAPEARRSGRRLYFSRRFHSMRVMINEAALEAGLRARGFEIVKPERLEVAEQIRMMREAEVVVGPTGAAMANALFAPAGARIVEIQPENFASQWVWAASRQAGAEWRGYVCASPIAPECVAWPHRIRRGFRFGYEPPIDDVLAFVDAAL
ncbi:glycosyltransferase family 61 protein [Caulobacter sp. LARHSG274]